MIKGCPTNHLQNAENFRFMNQHSQFRWARIFTTTICDICFCIFPGIFSRTDMAGGIWLGLQTVTICVEKKHWFSEQGWILRGLREETSAPGLFESHSPEISLWELVGGCHLGPNGPSYSRRWHLEPVAPPPGTGDSGELVEPTPQHLTSCTQNGCEYINILLGSSHCQAEVSDLERFAGCFAGAFWLDNVSCSLCFFHSQNPVNSHKSILSSKKSNWIQCFGSPR